MEPFFITKKYRLVKYQQKNIQQERKKNSKREKGLNLYIAIADDALKQKSVTYNNS